MISEVLQLCISNGLWAVLFVFLFLYQIKTNAKREQKYVAMIDTLTDYVGVIKKCGEKLNIVNANITQVKKLFLQRANA